MADINFNGENARPLKSGTTQGHSFSIHIQYNLQSHYCQSNKTIERDQGETNWKGS